MLRIKRLATLLLLTLVLTTAAWAKQKEVNIVATNDMHANIDAFPQLGAIVDSLRAIDPSLLVFSAGDNRTGNPINDMYSIPSYPVTALMNQIGYNGSALGNHEFDLGSLPRLIGLSNFRYICANIHADDSTGVRTVPYQVFDVEGVKVGVIGVIQVNLMGRPDTHPDNLAGITFQKPEEVIPQYEFLRKECDVVILLSHAGYDEDKRLADRFPWIDLIIGGHTHTQLTSDEPLRNGVLITQNQNDLSTATHITLTVDSGRVTSKKANYISVKEYPAKNELVNDIVQSLNDNPFFNRVLAQAETPFTSREKIGYMLCDAIRTGTDADIAIINRKGVRMVYLPEGDITMRNVLQIDPFGNNTILISMSGRDFLDFLVQYSRMERDHFPHLSGIHAELTIDDKDTLLINGITLYSEDGSEFDLHRDYIVATNSYITAVAKSLEYEKLVTINSLTSDLLVRYLHRKRKVNYQDVQRIFLKYGDEESSFTKY